MKVQIGEILENFPNLLSLTRGSPESPVSNIKSGATASQDSLIFVSTLAQLRDAVGSPARAWVVPATFLDKVPEDTPIVVSSANPYLAMALVAKRFFPQTGHHRILDGPNVHPAAVISPSALLGENCLVGPGAVIGDHCEIGRDCVIGANAVLEPGVKVGERTHIHPLVFIAHDCVIGRRCEIHPQTTIGTEGYGYAQDAQFQHHRITHYGRVVIEDDVHIGAGVQIDRGTFEDSLIGAGTKIDNHCHFGHNIRVGRNTLITGGMITAGSATIGSGCVFGGRVTVRGHISVADGSHFGGVSVIANNVKEKGEYAGFPLQPLKDEMRTRAAIKELPRLLKQVRRLMKHVGLDREEDK